MKQLKNPKFIILAAGILISVAFYFLKGPGNELLAASEQTEILVSGTAAEASGLAAPMESGASQSAAEDKPLPVTAELTQEQMDVLCAHLREALHEELAACCEEGYLESALAAGIAAAAETAERHAGMIDLNRAEKAELMQLEGIGEKRAQDILDYRARSGGFRTIEEIMQVKGIKESAFERIREKIYV